MKQNKCDERTIFSDEQLRSIDRMIFNSKKVQNFHKKIDLNLHICRIKLLV